MGRGRNLRVGNPERERAITLLGEHLTSGRLDVHEYDQRCATVAAARFAGDIAEVFDDLPAPRPEAIPATRPAAQGNGMLLVALGAALLVVAIMLRQYWVLVGLVLLGVPWFLRRR